ncbi:hypothetical protein D9758_005180 [Tetrapyrgos nigripes]|uniref:NAD(P)-binding protein n=1 Tax=Tetrapyrgos nigripes TaxID=182062 RepID=A0A8H5GWJ7_9AGAR|nr:hypothetical protein D9758_005180 [Tetrapyrgos nigripes]
MSTPNENLPVTHMSDVYPGINPQPYFDGQIYAGKVVFVTGASRGIGSEIALFYAWAGASLSLLSRAQNALDKTKKSILSQAPRCQIITFAVDVCESQAMKKAIDEIATHFGKIDIVVAAAGRAEVYTKPFTEYDPDNWWKTVEVNIRGVYNTAHFALPHLSITSGYFVVLGSTGAQVRLPFASAYPLSKLAVHRFVEYIKAEQPNVKAFAMHPGGILTEMTKDYELIQRFLVDSPQLPAATLLRLTSGKMDWLNGRYVSANWNLDEGFGKKRSWNRMLWSIVCTFLFSSAFFLAIYDSWTRAMVTRSMIFKCL